MIIAGTGHRPEKLGGYGQDIAHRLVKIAGEYLDELKPDTVISGMALGWDQALAAAAMARGFEWWAYVPFRGQEKMWPDGAKKLYHEMLSRANAVHYVCSPGYAGWKMQARNEAMVDHATHVLALWNGDGSGGTWNCVRYAQMTNKPIINAWEKWRLQ